MTAESPQRRPSSLRDTWADLSALQRISVIGIGFLVGVWAVFDRLAPELVTLFGGIIAAEEGRKAVSK